MCIYRSYNTEATPAIKLPTTNTNQPRPFPSHWRIGGAAPVLLFTAPLVDDPTPALTVVVAFDVLADDEFATEDVVEFEKMET